MNIAGNPLWRMLEGEWVNNQYHLQNFLGAGGFGAVYSAHEVVGNQIIRTVAIKLILIHDLNQQLGELQTADSPWGQRSPVSVPYSAKSWLFPWKKPGISRTATTTSRPSSRTVP